MKKKKGFWERLLAVIKGKDKPRKSTVEPLVPLPQLPTGARLRKVE